MMGMVLLVTIMALLNVASLCWSAPPIVWREFSVRYALGANKRTDSSAAHVRRALAGLLGAAAGLALVPEAEHLLLRWMSAGSADQSAFTATLDWRVLLFTLGISLVGSLFFSLAPAAAVLESAAIGFVKAAVGNGHRWTPQVPANLRHFANRIQPAADRWGRHVHPHHAEPAQRQRRDLKPSISWPSTWPRSFQDIQGRCWRDRAASLGKYATLPGIKAVGATNDEDLTDNNRGAT